MSSCTPTRAVRLLDDEPRVEHANDAAVHKVEENRDRLARQRRSRRGSDDDDVDRAELIFACFHIDASME